MARLSRNTDRLKRRFRKLLEEGLLNNNPPGPESSRPIEVLTDIQINNYRYAIVKCLNKPKSRLSRRESQIAWLAANGVISKQIAARLGISYFTVLTHLKSVYLKLGIGSRIDLVHRFLFMDEDARPLEKPRMFARALNISS